MFTIVISEKGGAERREAFDRNEISVGRVQGNDLMLPKGNVSKHHARLLYRDDRFIVTDLRSTNGTYVNGRKISQATIVREGDKIYIGDFVLRVEVGHVSGQPDVSRLADGSTATGGSSRDGAKSPPPVAESPAIAALVSAAAAASPSTPAALPAPQGGNLSHFPLERDPDSESAPDIADLAPLPPLPAPPRLPNSVEMRARAQAAPVSPGAAAALSRPLAAPPNPAAAPAGKAASPARPAPREGPHQIARRVALVGLIRRVTNVIDLRSLEEAIDPPESMLEPIERAVREQARLMRSEGEAPEGIDFETLVRDAVRELVGLGALEGLVEDTKVSEAYSVRHEHVVAVRDGQPTLVEPGFTSGAALRRALVRLSGRFGAPVRPDESIVERRLPEGVRLVAVGPPLSSAWSVTLRRPRRVAMALDELRRAGALSLPMATFLEACVLGCVNVLVVAAFPAAIPPVIAALAAAAPAGERVAILQDDVDLVVPQASVVPLLLGSGERAGETALAAAHRLGVDRIVVPSASAELGVAVVDAIARGAEAFLVGSEAPSLRLGLARLVARVALSHPGTAVEAAREAVAESFDVAVEVGWSFADGQPRVLRIAELGGVESKGIVTRDLFLSMPDAVGESAFIATGSSPRLASELALRGIRLDPSLFRRKG
jgi:pilus assembly protein CpaF